MSCAIQLLIIHFPSSFNSDNNQQQLKRGQESSAIPVDSMAQNSSTSLRSRTVANPKALNPYKKSHPCTGTVCRPKSSLCRDDFFV